MRILVVDDDRAVRDSLRRSLEFNGYEVALANDGVEALARINGLAPDALIVDVMMPRLDGIETTKALRAAGNDLPILVLTARDSVGDRVDGLDAGADDYLAKPFALEELLARVRAMLRRRSLGTATGEDEGPLDVRRPDHEPRHPRGRAGRPPDHLDPHRVGPARAVHAPAEAGARARLHPRRGVGLRLPDHRELPRGVRRLRPAQDRG